MSKKTEGSYVNVKARKMKKQSEQLWLVLFEAFHGLWGKNWLIISLAVHYWAGGSINFIWFIKLAILCSFSFSYKI